jgi:hypothetical protein
MSSVTSISADTTIVSKQKKTNYGKPIYAYIMDIYKKLTENDEITRTQLEDMIRDEVKLQSGLTVKDNTLSAHVRKIIINDPVRRNYGVNENNMDNLNLFYYMDENERGGKKKIRKYNPDNPPKGYKVYYKEKNTKENKEITIQ